MNQPDPNTEHSCSEAAAHHCTTTVAPFQTISSQLTSHCYWYSVNNISPSQHPSVNADPWRGEEKRGEERRGPALPIFFVNLLQRWPLTLALVFPSCQCMKTFVLLFHVFPHINLPPFPVTQPLSPWTLTVWPQIWSLMRLWLMPSLAQVVSAGLSPAFFKSTADCFTSLPRSSPVPPCRIMQGH